MYLTAHRVWSRKQDRDAIHAFHYRHPLALTTPIVVADIADNNPGELVRSSVVLTPRGNDVWSYLDLVAAIPVPNEELTRTLDAIVASVRNGAGTVAEGTADNVAWRFYANPNRIASRTGEARELGDALRAIYAKPKAYEPLVIRIERDLHVVRLRLDPASADSIRSLFGPDMAVSTVTLDHETLEVFESLRGPTYEHVIGVVTGLDPEQIESLGGVRFSRESDADQ
jgi:hypothetical protein